MTPSDCYDPLALSMGGIGAYDPILLQAKALPCGSSGFKKGRWPLVGLI